MGHTWASGAKPAGLGPAPGNESYPELYPGLPAPTAPFQTCQFKHSNLDSKRQGPAQYHSLFVHLQTIKALWNSSRTWTNQRKIEVLRSCENMISSPASMVRLSGESPATKVQRVEPVEEPLLVKKLSENAYMPKRGSALAAGYDLSSAYDFVVPARGKELIKTDLSIKCPSGTYGRVAPRSGLAWKNFIDTGAGVIDEDYRGPVGVILFNHSEQDFIVKKGDRVAQLVLERIATPTVIEVDDLDGTDRGAGGFGSTVMEVDDLDGTDRRAGGFSSTGVAEKNIVSVATSHVGLRDLYNSHVAKFKFVSRDLPDLEKSDVF
eukprot:gene21669-28686_t